MGFHRFQDRYVKTRKRHQCHGCCDHIPEGETVLKVSGIWEGEGFVNLYHCRACDEYMKTPHTQYDPSEDTYDGHLLGYDDYDQFQKGVDRPVLRTMGRWFDTLPDDVRRRAHVNRINSGVRWPDHRPYNGTLYGSLNIALRQAFVWKDTPEGHDYWQDLAYPDEFANP